METNYSSKSNLTVLIVDDHALLREGLLLMFRIYEEATAIGTMHQEMLSAVGQYKPDVVILGLGGKHGSCWSAVQNLRTQHPDVSLLVIDEAVCTRNIRMALALGVSGYWTKFATFSQIVEAVRRLATGDRSFCPEVDQYLSQTRHGIYYHPAHIDNPLQLLTPRETELLTLLAQGLTLKECSERMGISANTVDNHKTRLMRKLGVHKTVELVRLAVREGLVEEG